MGLSMGRHCGRYGFYGMAAIFVGTIVVRRRSPAKKISFFADKISIVSGLFLISYFLFLIFYSFGKYSRGVKAEDLLEHTGCIFFH